ncbi:hemolysin III family protein [Paludicola sp. MB14-C6]|uniref:PAQR family membrane homeostasis protein TrhA n=1 Tax=Paludihabitans sp. MB14-C6 TaxID=3070656 RepID=UPI0027DE2AC2|nr:hemolysin III family protein [Paludicola sp. MB14-C6]WMJ21988.1 hemolysin III family protein [Paludicola sp. MB14-C6]
MGKLSELKSTFVRTTRGRAPSIKMYSLGEELLNAITHGLGALFGVAGAAYLIVFTSLFCDAWSIVSASIYGGSLIILYTMSTLYHALTNETAKKVFRVFDHSTIFLLIAGTYTPYTLVTIREEGIWGWLVFGVVWGSAVVGITFNAISVEKFKKLSMILYIASGWAAVLAMMPIIRNLAPNGLWLMLLGGIFYTGGIVFYKMKHKKYFHGIWHLFVLAGSVSHFFSILFYVYQ